MGKNGNPFIALIPGSNPTEWTVNIGLPLQTILQNNMYPGKVVARTETRNGNTPPYKFRVSLRLTDASKRERQHLRARHYQCRTRPMTNRRKKWKEDATHIRSEPNYVRYHKSIFCVVYRPWSYPLEEIPRSLLRVSCSETCHHHAFVGEFLRCRLLDVTPIVKPSQTIYTDQPFVIIFRCVIDFMRYWQVNDGIN